MLVTEEEYYAQSRIIEQSYIELAEELTEQMFESMDWDRMKVDVNAPTVIAIWLKKNEIHCKEE